MKRTPLKRKTALRSKKISPLRGHKIASKGSKPPKTRKVTRKKLEAEIWDQCRRLVRERYGDTCYTCGAQNLEGRNWQCGHGKPKGALPLRFKYDIRNLRPQCMRDNIHFGGMSDIFISRLEREDDGIAFLLDACYIDEDKNAWVIRKDIPSMGSIEAYQFLENLLAQYKSIRYVRM